jgi:hypothetical protein
MKDAPKTLWFNRDRTRFFLISSELDLPSGEFILRRGLSHQKLVDETALQPYEIPREAAHAHLDSQAENIFDEAKNSVLTFLESFQLPEPPAPPPPEPETLEKLATGIEELAEAIAEQLRTQAQTVRNESKTAQADEADESLR